MTWKPIHICWLLLVQKAAWRCITDNNKKLYSSSFLDCAAHSLLMFQTQNDFMVICNVAKILELVIPLMDNPSETFLTTLEEDLMKLIIKYGMTVSVFYSVQLSQLALEEIYAWRHLLCLLPRLSNTV